MNDEKSGSVTAGFVSLVGAGPGDPDLLTRQALRCLRQADLVLYDALVSPKVLAYARRAQRFYVGKRAGRRAIDQDTINRLMVRAARRGRRVVRLKCGDPFVLGRGGEEALALRANGIAFEVVPGISSAIAAPALAGIPVTHRGLASGFVVVSGHAESAYGPIVDAIPSHGLTLVILMGLGARGEIAARLLLRGWRPSTPAAILCGASTPEAFVWVGTLGRLGDASIEARGDSPGTMIIGETVSLHAALGSGQEEPGDVAVGHGG